MMDAKKILRSLYQNLRSNEIPCPVCGEPVRFIIDYTPQTYWEPEVYEEYFTGPCVDKKDSGHLVMWNTDPEEHVFGYGITAVRNHARERQNLCDWVATELMYLDGMDENGETNSDTPDS